MLDAYIWILNVIDSCHTEFHLKAAKQLVKLFSKQFIATKHSLDLMERIEEKEMLYKTPVS